MNLYLNHKSYLVTVPNIFMFLVFYRFNFLSTLILAYTRGKLKKIVI